MNYMGLDLSCTGTGIVVLDEEGRVLATARDGWDLNRRSTVLDKIDRLLHITTTILDLVRVHGGNAAALAVGIEGYAFHAKGSTADLGELGGVVKTQLWLAHRIEPRILAVNTARSLALGNGRIKKKLVESTLAQRGFVFGDPDIADAYVIAEAVRLQHRREVDHGNDGSDGEGGKGREGGPKGGSPRCPRKRKSRSR